MNYQREVRASLSSDAVIEREAEAVLRVLDMVQDLPSPIKEEVFVHELLTSLRNSGKCLLRSPEQFAHAA